jgi:hypothetical protein
LDICGVIMGVEGGVIKNRWKGSVYQLYCRSNEMRVMLLSVSPWIC